MEEAIVILFNFFTDGFLILQSFLAQIITNHINKATHKTSAELVLPEIRIQQFPSKPHNTDPFIDLTNNYNIMPIFFMISFFYPCMSIVKEITTEKEKQLKVFIFVVIINKLFFKLSML